MPIAEVTFASTPMTATIGSEVDIDLHQPLDETTAAALRRELAERKLLVFRGQHLAPTELVALARHFGDVTRAHPILPPLDADHPEVLEIDATRSRQDPRYRDEYENDTWHTDVTFMANPPLGSILQAIVTAPAGGDTAFADLQAAYDSLSEPLRTLVDGLEAEHDGAHEFAAFLRTNPDGGTWDGRTFTVLEPVHHPVVRVHPETGRRGLFVNPTFTTKVLGLTKLESAHLLALLYEHALRPEHQVRVRWEAGDLAFWDNRSTLHCAVRDFGDHHRVMHRVTVRGDRPYGIAGPAAAS